MRRFRYYKYNAIFCLSECFIYCLRYPVLGEDITHTGKAQTRAARTGLELDITFRGRSRVSNAWTDPVSPLHSLLVYASGGNGEVIALNLFPKTFHSSQGWAAPCCPRALASAVSRRREAGEAMAAVSAAAMALIMAPTMAQTLGRWAGPTPRTPTPSTLHTHSRSLSPCTPCPCTPSTDRSPWVSCSRMAWQVRDS